MKVDELFVRHEFTIGAGAKRCFYCREPIGKEGRYTRVLHGFDLEEETVLEGVEVQEHFHPECILEWRPKALREVLNDFQLAFRGRAELEAKLDAKLARMAWGKAGAKLRDTDIELERDAKGRPRVRVLVTGMGTDSVDRYFKEHCPRKIVTSQKRSYRWVVLSESCGVGVDDPAIALLGAVLVVASHDTSIGRMLHEY